MASQPNLFLIEADLLAHSEEMDNLFRAYEETRSPEGFDMILKTAAEYREQSHRLGIKMMAVHLRLQEVLQQRKRDS